MRLESVATALKQVATDYVGLRDRDTGTGRPVGLPTQPAPLKSAGNKKAPAITLWRLCACTCPALNPVPPVLGGNGSVARVAQDVKGGFEWLRQSRIRVSGRIC